MLNRALKVIRQFHEMTQVELAEKLSVSKKYLSEIESGKRPISIDLLNEYSIIFELPVSSLIFFSESIGKKKLSSSKFKSAVVSKIIDVMEWVVEKDEKKLKTQY